MKKILSGRKQLFAKFFEKLFGPGTCLSPTGGKTPLELACARRPPDIVSIENASPGQLTLPNLEADEVVKRVGEVALQSYLKTRQCEDLRQDIAAGLEFL